MINHSYTTIKISNFNMLSDSTVKCTLEILSVNIEKFDIESSYEVLLKLSNDLNSLCEKSIDKVIFIYNYYDSGDIIFSRVDDFTIKVDGLLSSASACHSSRFVYFIKLDDLVDFISNIKSELEKIKKE